VTKIAAAALALMTSFGLVLAPGLARAEPARLALVIGSSAYTAYPELDLCRASAGSLAGALRRAGFQVTEKLNPSNGQMGAAIAAFAEAVARAPDTVAVSYICGYAVALDSRVFLLPASAALTRDTEVLSQGIVSRVFVNALLRSGASSGLILFDLLPLPGANAGLPLDSLVDPSKLRGLGFAAVQPVGPVPAGTTDLAAAAAAAVAAQDARAYSTILRSKLPVSARRTVVIHDPAEASAAVPALMAGTGTGKVNAVGSDPGSTAPDSLSMADTRRIQLALQRLGYYSGKVDGMTGPDTLAAIRRFQHELRVEMTGQLSTAQIERLFKDSQ
jgi:hypothetical protein